MKIYIKVRSKVELDRAKSFLLIQVMVGFDVVLESLEERLSTSVARFPLEMGRVIWLFSEHKTANASRGQRGSSLVFTLYCTLKDYHPHKYKKTQLLFSCLRQNDICCFFFFYFFFLNKRIDKSPGDSKRHRAKDKNDNMKRSHDIPPG